MLQASVMGMPYHRVIAENVDEQFTAALKSQAEYSFVVSAGSFQDPTYAMVRKQSAIIPLDASPEILLQRCHATTRNEIRRSFRAAEVQIHSTIDDFDAFYCFYTACEHHRGWLPAPPDELRNSFVIYGSWNGVPLSGASAYADHTRLRIGRIFSTRRAGTAQSSVSSMMARRVIYEFCRYGQAHGYGTLDLSGIDPGDPQKQGITFFKMGFGAQIVPMWIGRYMTPRFAAALPRIRADGYDVT